MSCGVKTKPTSPHSTLPSLTEKYTKAYSFNKKEDKDKPKLKKNIR